MIDLLSLMAFNAAYAEAIDSDDLERWPHFFTDSCHYRITNVDNEREGLPAGVVWADTRAMLEDRVAALREANIYERQRYRHVLGTPVIASADAHGATARTPFLVARVMATGETMLFASGLYHDRFVMEDNELRLAERVAVCDSAVTDTLMALPL
jgi:3-phenylpropionate/cinnamic acid dioxygenase small subunit